MDGGEFLERDAGEPAVERLVRALLHGMFGRAVQRVLEERRRRVGPADQILKGGELLADDAPPLRAGPVEHGRGRVQPDAEALQHQDRSQAPQLASVYTRRPARRIGETRPRSS